VTGTIPLEIPKVKVQISKLKALGYTSDQMLESIGVISLFSGITRIVDATGQKLPARMSLGISFIPVIYFVKKNRLFLVLMLALLIFYVWG
jgi:hypothetical protein